MIQHFRVARHTGDINKIREFYMELLGFKEIDSFTDHEGYSGIMLGFENHTWHLEFTISAELPHRVSDADDLLVLYFHTEEEYDTLVSRLSAAGMQSIISKNPYWDRCGKTYLDPDGNRIVLCKEQW